MLKTRAIQNLKDAVYDAINAGFFFDEIFQIIANTLNSYNKENKIPNWVAWHLTSEHATGPYRRPGNAWHEEY